MNAEDHEMDGVDGCYTWRVGETVNMQGIGGDEDLQEAAQHPDHDFIDGCDPEDLEGVDEVGYTWTNRFHAMGYTCLTIGCHLSNKVWNPWRVQRSTSNV